MNSNGASNVKALFNGNLNHGGCVLPSLSSAGFFFDSLSPSCATIISLTENALAQMSIYPNPSQGYLFFEAPTEISELDITIYNSTGQVMLKKRHPAESALDISELPKAMYFVEVRLQESVQRLRILKE